MSSPLKDRMYDYSCQVGRIPPVLEKSHEVFEEVLRRFEDIEREVNELRLRIQELEASDAT